jgi:zinc transport system substrate-binding protein
LRNAAVLCHAIAEAISALDPVNADYYASNLTAYIEKLLSLDEKYKAALENTENRTLLFADRFPFRYLLHDYDIHFYAAFSGCSAETEASFRTITFLAEKVDERNLTKVLVTESANFSIAETIIRNTESGDQQIMVLDSMQSANDDDRERGVTYLSIMESNLNVLKEALS